MATQCYQFQATVTPSNNQTSPLTVPLSIPVMHVDEIEVEVPPGPLGEVGFHLNVSGVQCIPYKEGDFIVANNETLRWSFDNLPESGSWSITLYNNGAYDHTLYIRLSVSPVKAEKPEQGLINFEGSSN